ncbi:MAG: sugar phosphate isomerase/epimerase family protein [Flavitalea sp.]
MTSRRSFIKSSSLISTGFLMSPTFETRKKSLIGLQLYTVRDAMQLDAVETLAKVAAIGYNTVEGATYSGSQQFYGLSASSFASELKKTGLVMPSNHYLLGQEKSKGEEVKGTLLHDWNQAVDDAAAAGLKYMVCSYLSVEERGGIDHYKQLAEIFNKAGETCKKAGIQLCYHNHDFEFKPEGSQLPYEALIDYSDKDLVKMELDLYWVTKAGHDPINLFNKYPGRFPLWHVKDMEKAEPHSFTEVGNGAIDFKKIFAQSKKSGMTNFFVEQDKCAGSPFDSISKSIAYIKKNLV